ncbi:hypothetical protein ROHU_019849 [Labeo rohita]|uniref:Uncharacterized protein n=1 Tax=Labeo rohita TaxID=84645 RepID=A0A498N473_LABRO|nr:hypothetical protein ROHU_019849 [Labeo rohita]
MIRNLFLQCSYFSFKFLSFTLLALQRGLRLGFYIDREAKFRERRWMVFKTFKLKSNYHGLVPAPSTKLAKQMFTGVNGTGSASRYCSGKKSMQSLQMGQKEEDQLEYAKSRKSPSPFGLGILPENVRIRLCLKGLCGTYEGEKFGTVA